MTELRVGREPGLRAALAPCPSRLEPGKVFDPGYKSPP